MKSSIVLLWICFSYSEDSTEKKWDVNVVSQIIPAESHQLMTHSISMARAQKRTQTFLKSHPNKYTERTTYTHSTFLINNYCLEFFSLIFCYHHQPKAVSVSTCFHLVACHHIVPCIPGGGFTAPKHPDGLTEIQSDLFMWEYTPAPIDCSC